MILRPVGHRVSIPFQARRLAALLIAASALPLAALGCAGNDDIEPSGRIVVFDTGDFGSHILVPAAGGKAQRLEIDGYEVAFSPDNSQVAISSERGLALVTLSSGRTTLIPNQPSQDRFVSGEISWAPDRRRLAFVNDETIFTISIDGSDLREVTRGSFPSWTHDGERFVFVSGWDVNTGYGDLAVLRIDGTDLRLLERGTDPAASPTSDEVAYATRTGVFVLPLAGGTPRLVVPNGFGPVRSPDGKFLAFTRYTTCGHAVCSGRVFVVPVEGGEPRPIGPTVGDPPGPEDWIR